MITFSLLTLICLFPVMLPIAIVKAIIDKRKNRTQQIFKNQLYLEDLKTKNETREKLHKDIDFLQAQIEMLEDLQRLIEKDLHNNNGNEKANLSRLISIDKQIHTTQKKIEKLLESLE